MSPPSAPLEIPALFDVAIVGAGPAGGAAALELAGRGLTVVVLEKAVPPRYKTCGGGVLWRALKLLPVDISSVVERECRIAELVHHEPPLRLVCQREYPVVSMVMRDRFDHLLLSSARARGGVRVEVGSALERVTVQRDHVELTTSRAAFRARYVIAADGANSVVARQTGRPALSGMFPALECELEFDEATIDRWRDTARFDFGLVAAGYGWVFPKQRHLSIGVGTTRRGATSLPEAYQTYLRTLGLEAPRSEQRHGYYIPCHPRAGLFGVPRVLFTGDAAGLADPVTAEGIGAAILSGQLAARAIVAGSEDPKRVQAAYQAALTDRLLADLRVARWLAWLLYERPRWCARLLARHGHGMAELMTQIVTGETTYRAAIRRPAHYLRLLVPRRRNRVVHRS